MATDGTSTVLHTNVSTGAAKHVVHAGGAERMQRTFMGCHMRKAPPKHALNVASGSVTPCSVPATCRKCKHLDTATYSTHELSSMVESQQGGLYFGAVRATRVGCRWHLGSVARYEVVHSLLRGEPADRRQHPECVAAQQNDILGVGPDAGHPRVVDVVDRIGDTRVLSQSAAASI